MKINYLKTVLLLILLSIVCGCGQSHRDHKSIDEVVDSFATSYFNWKFEKALKYVSLESERWLYFVASNVHQADIDILKKQDEDATVSIDNVDIKDSDAIAYITVHNYLRMDTIGKEGRIIKKAKFAFHLNHNNSCWMVVLNEVPRHIKHE
jgi:outer membrane lipopolysaccharide assembly protein LptE/RlpB